MFSSERSSDIYVKGWIKGVGIDDQKTDVHYRSLSGEGNFNWRFIFPFDYIKAEDRIIYPIKGTFDIEPHMMKANCELTLQVWDADIITRDNFIGKLFIVVVCAYMHTHTHFMHPFSDFYFTTMAKILHFTFIPYPVHQ
ncbi:unnamed protein product [Trichobilharzia regenti]|nr:unnamed protein product [Trichobilharzia regenti]